MSVAAGQLMSECGFQEFGTARSFPRRRPVTPSRSSGAEPNGGVPEQLDREAALADEQLGRRDVNRARRLERADGVERPAARWQSEIASDPMMRRRCAVPTIAAALSATSAVVVPSNDRISIVVLRLHAAQPCAVQERARPRSAVNSSPVPKS